MSTGLVEACCKLPPVVSEYKPTGETIKVGDLSVYVTGEKGKVLFKRKEEPVILNVYDIYGYHRCTSRVCDSIASHGFRVVQPDYYHGNPWPFDEPLDFPKLLALIAKEANDESIYRDTDAVIAYLKNEEGASISGVIGMCWGASIAVKLANRFPEIKAVASPHPSFLNPAAVADLKVPLYLIVTKDDAPHVDVIEVVKQKGGEAEKHSHVSSYQDVHHGFMAARWEEESEVNNKRANDGVHEFVGFFKKTLVA
ncbi:dienelactone hydrolase family-domain-containing protein [Cladochytrium replicatum]|nr:dienelactone hydrolase family-domain-containing protein [Cladochytrium replicatum]